MNIDKLFDSLNNGCLYDKLGQPLQLYDVIFFPQSKDSYHNVLTSGLILEILPEDKKIGIEKNNITTGIDWISGDQVLKVNDILKAKDIDPKSYYIQYKQNLKLNTKNIVYVFYCICNNVEGLLFFKPTHSLQYMKIKQLKEIINQYKNSQFYIFPLLKVKDWKYNIHITHPISVNKWYQIVDFKGYYTFSDIFSIHQQDLDKCNNIEFNKFIPISFNKKDDKNIDLIVNNNIINKSILRGNVLYNDLMKLYRDFIPDVLKCFKDQTYINEGKETYLEISKLSFTEQYK